MWLISYEDINAHYAYLHIHLNTKSGSDNNKLDNNWTNKMASYVHKEIPNNTVVSFCTKWERLNIEWKAGRTIHALYQTRPSHDNILGAKRNPDVSGANWANFEHGRTIHQTQAKNWWRWNTATKYDDGENNEAPNNRKIPSPEPWQSTQMICDCDEENQITVTKNQVAQLHLFILNWEKPIHPSQELITTEDLLRESHIEMREMRTIREFKHDILKYLNRRGIQWWNPQSTDYDLWSMIYILWNWNNTTYIYLLSRDFFRGGINEQKMKKDWAPNRPNIHQMGNTR